MSTSMRIGNYKHGGYTVNKPEYNSWRAMVERCNNPKYWCYHRYGGRGIKVCDRWLGTGGFINFLDDMGKKPTPKHTIDRIDNDSGYSPENCRWSDDITQKNNTSRNRIVTIDGVDKSISEWCRVYGIKISTVYNRHRDGMTFEEALKAPMSVPGKRIRPFGRAKPTCRVCGSQCKKHGLKFCSNDCYLKERWGFIRQKANSKNAPDRKA